MIHFSRSLRLCVELNRNGVRFREISSLMSRAMEKAKKKEQAEGSFNSVARNTIHRLNFIGETVEMGEISSLLYPGSLSTVSDGEGSSHLTSTEVRLKKLIDFNNTQTRNKLTILLMKCPRMLYITLKEACPLAEHFDDVSIIQLSYEKYDAPEQGRKDCLMAANEIGFRLTMLNRWMYFSALAAPIHPDDEYLCLFKNKLGHVREDLAANLHVKITKEDGCVKILSPPFNDSVGIIYANIPDVRSFLQFVCEINRAGIKKSSYLYDD